MLTYAFPAARPALAILFRLDERLGQVVARTTEPTIGLIRLAWWRERLEALDAAPPPAEPLLAEISTRLVPAPGGVALAELEAGWAALLHADPLDEAALAEHARGRGGVLFGLAAGLLGAADARVGAAGEGWALADFARHVRDETVRRRAEAMAAARLAGLFAARWPRSLRPLGALAAAATLPDGSPSRVWRMLAHRLTGR